MNNSFVSETWVSVYHLEVQSICACLKWIEGTMGCCSVCLGNGDIYFYYLYYCANTKFVILINFK
jgi:hypothetical protein